MQLFGRNNRYTYVISGSSGSSSLPLTFLLKCSSLFTVVQLVSESNSFLWVGAGLGGPGPFFPALIPPPGGKPFPGGVLPRPCGVGGFRPAGCIGGGGCSSCSASQSLQQQQIFSTSSCSSSGSCCQQPSCCCCQPSCQQQSTICCQQQITCCQQQSSSCSVGQTCSDCGSCGGVAAAPIIVAPPIPVVQQPFAAAVAAPPFHTLPPQIPLPNIVEEEKVIYLAVPADSKMLKKHKKKEKEDEEETNNVKVEEEEEEESEVETTVQPVTTKKKSNKKKNLQKTTKFSTTITTPTPERNEETEETEMPIKAREEEINRDSDENYPVMVNKRRQSAHFSEDYPDRDREMERATSKPTLVVADVSTRAKKLIPTDLFEKRHSYLQKLKVSSSGGGYRQFSAPSYPRFKPTALSETCNNMKIARLISRAMVDDVAVSKIEVRETLKRFYGGKKFDVICARGSFSYNIYADKYCEVKKKDITCVAFI